MPKKLSRRLREWADGNELGDPNGHLNELLREAADALEQRKVLGWLSSGMKAAVTEYGVGVVVTDLKAMEEIQHDAELFWRKP